MSNKFCVANFAKHHSIDIKHMQNEARRLFKDKNQYKNTIHFDRSKDNIILVDSVDWCKSIDEILKKYALKPRRDAVLFTTTVYGFSSDWEDEKKDQIRARLEDENGNLSPSNIAAKIDDEIGREKRAYFEKCLQYENTRGECFSAIVHVDENGSWHMHTATVPVLPSAKDPSKMSLSAKRIFGNKVAMSKAQDEFFEMCGKPHGMVRGKCRVETHEQVKHLTEVEYQLQAERRKIQQREEQKLEAQRVALANQQRELEEREESVDESTQRIASYETDLNTREKKISERERNATHRETLLDQKESQLTTRMNDVVERERETSRQATKLDQRARELDSSQRSIVKARQQLMPLYNDLLAEKKRIESLPPITVNDAKPNSVFKHMLSLIARSHPNLSALIDRLTTAIQGQMPTDDEVVTSMNTSRRRRLPSQFLRMADEYERTHDSNGFEL